MFYSKWKRAVAEKNSLLCVGVDPTGTSNKVEWCLGIIRAVAPYAAAVKINRNYVKDLSRNDLKKLTDEIHSYKMLAIDDSKLVDIGSTNDAGFQHARAEGFDAVTYSPFAGNVAEAVGQAHTHGLGIIVLVLMSNPEYVMMKNAEINGKKAYIHFVEEARKYSADGIVVGAPSDKNHITLKEIKNVQKVVDFCVLVPGIGAQGGDAKSLIEMFGDNTIVNVGRAIMFADDVGREARKYNEMINAMRRI